jgi:AraC-like DNA-binding protein
VRHDLLSNVVDLLDPVVHCAGEVLADPGTRWRVPAPRAGWTWVAPRYARGAVWLDVPADPLLPALGRGEVAVVHGSAVRAFASDWSATAPPRATEDLLFCGTGVFHGTVTFGGLLDEVLAPPPIIVARGRSLSEGLVDLLGPVEPPAHRMGAALSDAIARALVLQALATVTPPWAADGRLAPALTALTVRGRPASDLPTTAELAEACRLPTRTFSRRFETATGRSPTGFARWWRTAVARSAARGPLDVLDPRAVDDVARRAGFAGTRSLRRAIDAETALGSRPVAVADRGTL